MRNKAKAQFPRPAIAPQQTQGAGAIRLPMNECHNRPMIASSKAIVFKDSKKNNHEKFTTAKSKAEYKIQCE